DLERERGITIKAQTVRMNYLARDGLTYELNLIDTPGHVDFSYEVSRSLSACEGALLVVDASQGVEAQTLANFDMAQEGGLTIVPLINKIDLPTANAERVRRELEDVLGIAGGEAIEISAKEGRNIVEVLEAVVARIPPPRGAREEALRALVFDIWFDAYQGAVLLCRLFDGEVAKGSRVRLLGVGRDYEVSRIGVFSPEAVDTEKLVAGEVGFVIAGVKEISHARIGDTMTDSALPTDRPLPGFKVVKPMVFAGLYPADTSDYESLRDALEKLRLNDSSFNYEAETSEALGFGFRCGFLGLLHMEIIRERLEREYDLDLITTAPTVSYHVFDRKGNRREIENPVRFPSPS
ncbi:MAG: translation elongation factor 4, partial [Vicinamibacteria bacterium]